MFFLAAHINKLKLPKMENKLGWYSGITILIIVTLLVLLDRIKVIFKVKSLGLLIVFVMLLLLQSNIQTLTTILGLMLIPLLIDDIIVNGYFKILNVNKYWDIYRDVIKSERK